MNGYKLITCKEYKAGDIVQVNQMTYEGLEQFTCVLIEKISDELAFTKDFPTAIKLNSELVILSNLGAFTYRIVGKYVKDNV